MAETLIEIVLENLIPLVQSEFAASFGIKEKAEEMSRTLELIKAVLDDAEQKQWSNRPLKVWLQQLKDAMYVLDDILDQLPTESSQLGCFSSLNPKNMMHQRKLGKKLNKMIGRLDRIAQHRSNFDLRQGIRKRSSEVAEWRQTSSTIAVPQVYGRDEDKGRVVEFLLSPSRSSESLSVYPIVGLGDDFSGEIYFKMHDLVHDLAQSISEKECMCLESEKQIVGDFSRNLHHIGFPDLNMSQFKKRDFEKVESLRTFYQLNVEQLTPTNDSLRVLCIYGRKIPSFGSLSCLRYLELHGLGISSLPASICNLRRLKILKLKELWCLRLIPKHLTRMRNLRHLVIDKCPLISGMFPEAHKLCNLRTLSVYIVKSKKGHSLAELSDLNLGGKLRIEGLANVGRISEAEDANLKRKQDLTKLSLSWDRSGKTKSDVGAEEVLEAVIVSVYCSLSLYTAYSSVSVLLILLCICIIMVSICCIVF
ncbi:putative disease resistance protein RGA1 [Arachis hypogaea]|uniref:putative disease resistance protein RGA1 n=1 Tax=Arachis hypogaea TaxID=3818 RepID=UPI003B2167C7